MTVPATAKEPTMPIISKALVGTIAAGAMAMTVAATPVHARDRDGGIDAGEVIAGAVILGGLAAILSSSDRRNGYDYDDRNYRGRYDDRNYNRQGNPQRAIERCVRATERYSNRNSRGRANVTDVYDVDRRRDGWRIRGNMVLQENRGGYNRNYRGRGYRNNDRYDQGRFSCTIRNGRVDKIDIDGIRGL